MANTHTTAKPKVVVFDIDGTVADCRHRQHHALADPPDWEAFFAGSDLDSPLTEGVALALQHAAIGHLAWLTGRPERYRATTTAWLHALDLPTTRLHMRPDDDMRPAPVFKAERLAQLAAEHEILLVVDDDDLVVATLREAGWLVHHAKWMSR
jgi:FMN phosphatase YigB (HAD superfamily)